jgi:hypothetical protein
MPIVIGPDHAGAIPHDEGAERRLCAIETCAAGAGGRSQIVPFCTFWGCLGAEHWHAGRWEPKLGA